jgi:hypothetical protein
MVDDPFLNGVERDANGRAIILARWGWIKMEYAGRTVVVAATYEEALAKLREAGERSPETVLGGGCAAQDPNNTLCYNKGPCQGNCQSRSADTGIRFCACIT